MFISIKDKGVLLIERGSKMMTRGRSLESVFNKQLLLQMINFQQKKRFNKSIYNPVAHNKTQVCLIMSNILTSRSSKHPNIRVIPKFLSPKQQHGHNKIKEKKKLSLHRIQIDGRNEFPQRNRKRRQKMVNGIWQNSQKNTIISSINYNNTSNQYIDQQLIISHRKNYYSCLDKCKVVTNSFDNLKNQIVNKAKLNNKCKKHGNCKDKTVLFQGITNKYRQKNKQNIEHKTQRNFIIRHKCQNNLNKKAQRYMELTVAQFMDQSQENISAAITKKFDELRKSQVKSNDGQQKNCTDQPLFEKCIKSVAIAHKYNEIFSYRQQALRD